MHKIKKTAYTGSLAINIRNLNQAMGTFSSNNINPVSINELSNLLQLLESFVMSSNIYYDGTLPPNDLENTNLLLSKLNQSSDFKSLSVDIKPILFESDIKILKVCEESIIQAFELIKIIPNEKDVNSIDGEIENFTSYFIKDEYKYSDRYNDALQIVSDISEGKETFRGSKCLAGILVSKVDNIYVYDFVKKLFNTSMTDAAKRNLIAKLIDRFRINFISEQASYKQAAYLANPAIEGLRSQQTSLFWQYTMRRIGKNILNENSVQNLSETSQQLFETFPIGLSVLMNTPGRNPEALFDTANTMKDKVFNKIMTSETPKERIIHSFSNDEFYNIQDSLFLEKFNKYNSMSKLKRLTLKGTRLILLKGIGSLVSGGFDVLTQLAEELPIIELFDEIPFVDNLSSILGNESAGMIGNFTSYQIDMVAKLNQDKYHDYISKNKKNLLRALDDIENATAISNKVERLFKRPLG